MKSARTLRGSLPRWKINCSKSPVRAVRLHYDERPVQENIKTDRELLNDAQNVTFRQSDFQPEVLDINWYTIHKYF